MPSEAPPPVEYAITLFRYSPFKQGRLTVVMQTDLGAWVLQPFRRGDPIGKPVYTGRLRTARLYARGLTETYDWGEMSESETTLDSLALTAEMRARMLKVRHQPTTEAASLLRPPEIGIPLAARYEYRAHLREVAALHDEQRAEKAAAAPLSAVA